MNLMCGIQADCEAGLRGDSSRPQPLPHQPCALDSGWVWPIEKGRDQSF